VRVEAAIPITPALAADNFEGMITSASMLRESPHASQHRAVDGGGPPQRLTASIMRAADVVRRSISFRKC
jgi:hypothetical protein